MDCHGLLGTVGLLQQLVSSKRDEPSGEQNTNMSVKGCRSMRSSAAPEKPGAPMTASAFSERRRRSAARCKLLCLKGAREGRGMGYWGHGRMPVLRGAAETCRNRIRRGCNANLTCTNYKSGMPNTVCLFSSCSGRL